MVTAENMRVKAAADVARRLANLAANGDGASMAAIVNRMSWLEVREALVAAAVLTARVAKDTK